MSTGAFRVLAGLDCSLDAASRADRERTFAALAERAVEVVEGREPRLTFPPAADLAAEVAKLAALEAECCGASFDIDIGPAAIVVTIKR